MSGKREAGMRARLTNCGRGKEVAARRGGKSDSAPADRLPSVASGFPHPPLVGGGRPSGNDGASRRRQTALGRAVSGGGEVLPLHRQLAAAEQAVDGDGAKLSEAALARAALCRRLENLMLAGDLNATQAIAELRAAEADAPSANTLRRWLKLWRGGGASALADQRSGRARLTYGWEARAIELWNQPQCPARATVAWQLRGEGWRDATETRVRRYLNALPASVGGENTRRRRGAHHFRQNFTPHVIRDETPVDVGMIYEGDGHTCDVHVQHPATGKRYRPELTVWIDVRSHFVAGWWLSEAESAVSTLFSLSHAFTGHDHVPAALHVDPGSGFKNAMMQAETVGWLNKLGVTVFHARPGNARGKGLVEGWFRHFEERCGKLFDTFVGQNRTDDLMRRPDKSAREGKITVPSLRDYAAAVQAYIDSYNANPQRRLGCAPAELWGRELQRAPVGMSEAMLLRPALQRKVRRASVTLFRRRYTHPNLYMVDGEVVEVEYNLLDDSRVWINRGGRRLCEAHKSSARPWVGASVIDDLRLARAAGQEKRLARKLAEAQARARPALDGQAAVQHLELPADTDVAAALDPFDCLPDDGD